MKPKRPTDMNQLAASIVALASGEPVKIPMKVLYPEELEMSGPMFFPMNLLMTPNQNSN